MVYKVCYGAIFSNEDFVGDFYVGINGAVFNIELVAGRFVVQNVCLLVGSNCKGTANCEYGNAHSSVSTALGVFVFSHCNKLGCNAWEMLFVRN